MTRKKARGTLSDGEKALWQKVTENITALDNNQVARPLIRRGAYRGGGAPRESTYDFGKAFGGSFTEQYFAREAVDHNWHQKLRRGKVKPDGRIDLHGMTEERAHAALNRYIEDAQRHGKRFILVITGKGGKMDNPGRKLAYGDMSHRGYERGRGVLKTNVPRWLSQENLAMRIVSYTSANAEHGGDGALYVILKRNRG
ncbi:MAG: Smr/MutS family protein [Emcibacter sp.]|nr:Smr/MutS family protein [Emcibacter sp.]